MAKGRNKKGTARKAKGAARKARAKKARAKKARAQKANAKKSDAKKTDAKKTDAKKTDAKRARRAPRIKVHKGPLQMGLPLQMPFAFGHDAFAERAPPTPEPSEPNGPDDGPRAEPAATQPKLFGD